MSFPTIQCLLSGYWVLAECFTIIFLKINKHHALIWSLAFHLLPNVWKLPCPQSTFTPCIYTDTCAHTHAHFHKQHFHKQLAALGHVNSCVPTTCCSLTYTFTFFQLVLPMLIFCDNLFSVGHTPHALSVH